MAFPTPTETAVSTETETETEEELSVYEKLSDEIRSQLQEYRMVVETYRGVRKLCATHLFDSPEGVTNADIAALADQSPIADHFVFYRNQKNDMKADFQQLREDGEIPNEVGLRGFKDEYDADFEYEVLSKETAPEWGVDPAAFYEDEDEITVPDEYEAPTDEDGALIIWNETEDGEYSLRQVLEIADETEGIGPKTLARLEEALEEAR